MSDVGNDDKTAKQPSDQQKSQQLNHRNILLVSTTLAAASAVLGGTTATPAQAQHPAPAVPPGKQPNIVFIMGDDIGMWNIGAHHRGLMVVRTPNIDKLAAKA
jgi:hypothetical protein